MTLGAVPEGTHPEMLSEDGVKRASQLWLEESGWQVSVIWGRGRGIDVIATKDGRRWVIEARDAARWTRCALTISSPFWANCFNEWTIPTRGTASRSQT